VVHKRALGVGFLAGGYGQEELERAGAFRVYSDAADMLMQMEQLGYRGDRFRCSVSSSSSSSREVPYGSQPA
jgi:hypothetical protein